MPHFLAHHDPYPSAQNNNRFNKWWLKIWEAQWWRGKRESVRPGSTHKKQQDQRPQHKNKDPRIHRGQTQRHPQNNQTAQSIKPLNKNNFPKYYLRPNLIINRTLKKDANQQNLSHNPQNNRGQFQRRPQKHVRTVRQSHHQRRLAPSPIVIREKLQQVGKDIGHGQSLFHTQHQKTQIPTQ